MTLELSNVSITLGGRQLVKGLDLKLAPGEVVGLLGPNGAGKTTTFNLVIGLQLRCCCSAFRVGWPSLCRLER